MDDNMADLLEEVDEKKELSNDDYDEQPDPEEIDSIENTTLLFDSQNPNTVINCASCRYKSNVETPLVWHEYNSVLTKDLKCNHCQLTLPRDRDYISCDRNHITCLYCVELLLFRVQLALFVSNPNETRLDKEWERDYVKRTIKKHGRDKSTNFDTSGFLNTFRGIGSSIRKSTAHKDNRDESKDSNDSKESQNGCFGCCKPKPEKQFENIIKQESSHSSRFEHSISTRMIAAAVESQGNLFSNNGDMKTNAAVGQAIVSKPVAVALLIKRLDQGIDVKLPPGIIHLDYDKYGVYCFSYILGKLESKQRKKLFMILEFISMIQPTTTTIKLISEYKKSILMFPRKEIDNILLAVIRGSKFSICASLKTSHLAKQLGIIDIANKDAFDVLAKKYEGIAIEIIKDIESHHLATILLETPSDIDDQSPLEMAFDFESYNFLSQSKVQKISTQIWHKSDFLKPKNSFEELEWHWWDTLKTVVLKPRTFFFQPFGKYFIETGAYVLFILLFTYLLAGTRPTLYDEMGYLEILFWYLACGYIGYEFYDAFMESGVANYLTAWTNYIDLVLCINLIIVFVLRATFVFAPHVDGRCTAFNWQTAQGLAEWNYNNGLTMKYHKQCPTHIQIEYFYWSTSKCGPYPLYSFPQSNINTTVPGGFPLGDMRCIYDASYFLTTTPQYVCDCWWALEHYLQNSCCRKMNTLSAIIFNFLWGINAILFWARVLYFYETHRRLGPLLNVIGRMVDDIKNYLMISFLLLIGFGLAVRTIIGDYSNQFNGITATLLYIFKSMFLKIDFGKLAACSEDPEEICSDGGWVSDVRSSLGQILMCAYLVIALCMIRILVAMFAATYNGSIKSSKYQVMYARLKQAYELDRSSGLISAPLNIVAFTVALLWAVADITMIFLINRYIDIENISYGEDNIEDDYARTQTFRDNDKQRTSIKDKTNSLGKYIKSNVFEGKFFKLNNFKLNLAKPNGDTYFKRFKNGISLLLGVKDTDRWICSYCRQHNYNSNKYPIEDYLKQFSPRNDEADEKVIKVYQPHICRKCYRNKYPIWRSEIVLREISFFVFMIICWPVIVILTLLPAMISKVSQILKQVAITQDQEEELEKAEDDDEAYSVRKMRSIAQMEYHWRSNPDTYNMEHQKLLRENIKYVIKTNKVSKDHLITPNINKIVDDVITDNTPLQKIRQRVEDLFSVVENSTKIQLAQIKENILSGIAKKPEKKEDNEDNSKDKDDKKKDDDDDDDEPIPFDKVASENVRKEVMKDVSSIAVENDKNIRFGESTVKDDVKNDELLAQVLKTQQILQSTKQNSTNIIDNAVKDQLFVNKIETDAQKHHRLYKRKSMMKLQKLKQQKSDESDFKLEETNKKEKEKDLENTIEIAINGNKGKKNKEKVEKVENRDAEDAP